MTLDIWPSRKALNGLLQNTYLMLNLIYHKHTLLITTVVDDSIFLEREKMILFYPGITMMKL